MQLNKIRTKIFIYKFDIRWVILSGYNTYNSQDTSSRIKAQRRFYSIRTLLFIREQRVGIQYLTWSIKQKPLSHSPTHFVVYGAHKKVYHRYQEKEDTIYGIGWYCPVTSKLGNYKGEEAAINTTLRRGRNQWTSCLPDSRSALPTDSQTRLNPDKRAEAVTN